MVPSEVARFADLPQRYVQVCFFLAFRVLTPAGQSRTIFFPSIDLRTNLGVVQHMNQHKDLRK
jgi:hypothetical protein